MRQKGSFGGSAASFIIIGVMGSVLLLGCGFAVRQLVTGGSPSVATVPSALNERPTEQMSEKPSSSIPPKDMPHQTVNQESGNATQLPQTGGEMPVVHLMILLVVTMASAYYIMSRRMLPKF